jgi:hypothetical protein
LNFGLLNTFGCSNTAIQHLNKRLGVNNRYYWLKRVLSSQGKIIFSLVEGNREAEPLFTNEIFIFFVTCLCHKISISYKTVQQFFRPNYHYVNFKQWCNYDLFSRKRGLFYICMKLINYNIYKIKNTNTMSYS